MPTQTLSFLADISWELGLIGLDEYKERIDIAHWLSDEEPSSEDPRGKLTDDSKNNREGQDDFRQNKSIKNSSKSRVDDNSIFELIALNCWYFTGSDPDSCPSIPHGHYSSATRQWPKLNPYTGRVFSNKHQEDTSRRLRKKEMRILWRDEKFRDYCRKHILWYMQEYTYYHFRLRHPLRLPRW